MMMIMMTMRATRAIWTTMPEDDDYGISGMEAKRFGFTVLLKEIDYQWLLRPLFFHKVFIRNMISFCNTNFFRLLNASADVFG